MKRLLDRLGAKRFVALLIGPGIAAIALDSAVAHMAGKGGVGHPAQLVPLAYAAAALVIMAALALPRVGQVWFMRGVRVLGAGSAAVGAIGTFFHLQSLVVDLSDERLSWNALEGAVALAPPMFAPGAFVAVGALLWVLASPRLELRILPKAQSQSTAHVARPATVP